MNLVQYIESYYMNSSNALIAFGEGEALFLTSFSRETFQSIPSPS